MKNYYEVLQIADTATSNHIKNAYRELAKKHHPDLNPNNPTAEVKFKEIQEAYEVLSNAQKKASYDYNRQFYEVYDSVENTHSQANPQYSSQEPTETTSYNTQEGDDYSPERLNEIRNNWATAIVISMVMVPMFIFGLAKAYQNNKMYEFFGLIFQEFALPITALFIFLLVKIRQAFIRNSKK